MPGYGITVCFHTWRNCWNVSQSGHLFNSHQQRYKFQLVHILANIWCVSHFYFSHSSGRKVVFWMGAENVTPPCVISANFYFKLNLLEKQFVNARRTFWQSSVPLKAGNNLSCKGILSIPTKRAEGILITRNREFKAQKAV